jgi:hypothetical protein
VRLRIIAAGLVALAVVLRLLVAAPAQRDIVTGSDAFRAARDQRHALTQALGLAERREARRRKAVALLASVRAEPGDPVTRLRRDAVASVAAIGVSRVRLAVSPARPPVAAALRLSARGSLAQATRLSADLTTRWGLVLERVRFTPEGDEIAIDIDGLRLLGGS